MKKFIPLCIAMALILSIMGISPASAGSGSVSISGNTSIKAGKTYTYTVSVALTNTMDYIGEITCSGIFSGTASSAEFHSSSNANGTATGTIAVTVSSGAKPGDTGVIHVNGSGSTCVLDGEGNIVDVVSFSASGSKTITIPAASTASASTTPKKTTASSPSASPSPSPSVTPEQTEWELAADSINAMQPGAVLSLNITESTKIPADLLLALCEKQGVLTLNFGSYQCTIDGSTLSDLSGDISYVDFGLSFTAEETLSNAVGGTDVYQLHFNHEGQFPGKFTFSFKAEKSKPGDALYLYYYYDQADVIEGKAFATVNEEGYASFCIYHCSSYFISDTVIEGSVNSFISTDTEATDPDPQENPGGAQSAEPVNAGVDPNDIPGSSVIALITVSFATAMLTLVLTMLIFRVGVFKKRFVCVNKAVRREYWEEEEE